MCGGLKRKACVHAFEGLTSVCSYGEGRGGREREGDWEIKSVVKKSDLSWSPKKMEANRESDIGGKLHLAVPQPWPVGGAINLQ